MSAAPTKVLFALCLAGFLGGLPAYSGLNYQLVIDKFGDEPTALYDSSFDECKLTRTIRSRLYACRMVVAGYSHYYAIWLQLFTETSVGELEHRGEKPVKAIVTFLDGSTRKVELRTKLGKTISPNGKNLEIVSVYLLGIFSPEEMSDEVFKHSDEYDDKDWVDDPAMVALKLLIQYNPWKNFLKEQFMNIKQIEVKYDSNQYLWISNPVLTKKALMSLPDFEE